LLPYQPTSVPIWSGGWILLQPRIHARGLRRCRTGLYSAGCAASERGGQHWACALEPRTLWRFFPPP